MQLVSINAICPSLPEELQDRILEKTDVTTKLLFGREDLVNPSSIHGELHRLLVAGDLPGVQRLYHHDAMVINMRYTVLPISRVVSAIGVAADQGHLNIIEWIHTEDKNPKDVTSQFVMDCAACKGHLHVLKWLHGNRYKECSRRAIDFSAKYGHLDVLKWLEDKEFFIGCSRIAIVWAAENGHRDVVRWLHENRWCWTFRCPPWSRDAGWAMDRAAKNGHLDVVKFLHRTGVEACTESAIDWAAKNGHLDVVMFLYKRRREGYSGKAMVWAARKGHLDIVRFLHDVERRRATVPNRIEAQNLRRLCQ